MLVGSGSDVGEAMVHAPELRAISFTGSNKIGNALYVKAAQRGAKVTCEMGGKNAVIVMPGCRSRQGRDGDPWRRVRLDRSALHRHFARDRASDVKNALVERLVAMAKKIRARPGVWTHRPIWGRRSTRSSGRR